MCKVTVIMPSLNVADYIGKCLDSVVGQTLTDIEILAIDAGSADGTAEIIRACADKDDRIRFIHSDRKSYGYQINLGLSRARGEYVGIVETDDWIEQDAYEILYRSAREYDADYVRGVAECYKETGNGLSYGSPINMFPKKMYEENGGIFRINPREQREIVLKDLFLWNGIYKRDFLRGIRLNETAGAAYQDVGFLSQVYDKAENAVYIDHPIYHYRKDNETCSTYSRNAFRYLVEEYQFVHTLMKPDDEIWKLWNDARYFHQIYKRFQFMAETGSYWEEAESYIGKIYAYFRERQDVLPFLGEIQREGFMLFLDSPEKLYGFMREKYVLAQQEWERFLTQVKNREIVIFGSGKRGYFLQFLLTGKNTGRILGYCDNDSGKTGEILHGLPVRTLDEWIRETGNRDVCYVISAKSCAEEINKQLLENGIKPEHIVQFGLPMDFSVL